MVRSEGVAKLNRKTGRSPQQECSCEEMRSYEGLNYCVSRSLVVRLSIGTPPPSRLAPPPRYGGSLGMIAHLRAKVTSLLLLAMLAIPLLLQQPSPSTALHSPRFMALRCGCGSATQGPLVKFKVH